MASHRSPLGEMVCDIVLDVKNQGFESHSGLNKQHMSHIHIVKSVIFKL